MRTTNAEPILRRKAHSVSGGLFGRAALFEPSLHHLEQALRISHQIGNPSLVLATLSNIVTVFLVIGLIDEAAEVLIGLERWYSPDADLKRLRLQNAINGAIIAEQRGDDSKFLELVAEARRFLNVSENTPAVTRAYVCAIEAIAQIKRGSPEVGLAMLHSWPDGLANSNNLRASTILAVAKTRCVLACDGIAQAAVLKSELLNLLKLTQSVPTNQEQLLRALVSLYELDAHEEGRRWAEFFGQRLRDLLVNVKHRQFFESTAKRVRDGELYRVAPASYDIAPFWRSMPNDHGSRLPARLFVSSEDQLQLSTRLVAGEPASLRKTLRSRCYDAAEDLAVAADYFVGRLEYHSFRIGKLAALLFRRLGAEPREVAMMELACRLHDVGKIAIDGELQRLVASGNADEYLLRDHTIVGSELLAFSMDPTIVLARTIARHHHEWWNGLGFPDGLAGEQIPLPARICAVADFIISLLHEHWVGKPWDSQAVRNQIQSMSGVQLDPLIVREALAMDDIGGGWLGDLDSLGQDASMQSAFIAVKRRLVSACNA